jgi:hypothetical protein
MRRRRKTRRFWLDYDEEADVLYISLKRPQRATKTVEVDKDNLLLRYRNKDSSASRCLTPPSVDRKRRCNPRSSCDR